MRSVHRSDFTLSSSAAGAALTSADSSDDFQPIRRIDGGFAIAAPRDDLAVFLDGDALAFERECADNVGHGCDRPIECPRVAIDGELHRYSLYLRIALRRNRIWRSKRAQPTQTARCSRS